MDRVPQITSVGGLTPTDVKGKITFKHVSFRYPSRPDEFILDDFNLELEPGKVVALVGMSGRFTICSVPGVSFGE